MGENLAGRGTGAGLSQVRWAWVTVGLVLTPADGGPASVLLQLCPVLKAGFEDMRGELLNLTKGRCTTLSPFFLTAELTSKHCLCSLPKASLPWSGLSSNSAR